MFTPAVPCRITSELPPSLVQGKGITSSPQALFDSKHLSVPTCPHGGWLKGICKEHLTERWIKMSCKCRTCEVCGQERKEKIAWRISRGIGVLGGEDGAGWHVLTFDKQVVKAEAVRISNQYIQWLTRYCRRVYSMVIEWAKVWEIHKSGRLHLNLIVSPWRFVKQTVLARKWHDLGGGSVMWIERVGCGIGNEAAKASYRIGKYFAKYDQMVLTGRGVSYSKGFPQLPHDAKVPRRGEIDWQFVGSYSAEGILHWYETELGHWEELTMGEYRSFDGEKCDCFEFQFSPVKRARYIRLAMERKNGGG